MRTGPAHRLWMIGGALGAVFLLAIGWLFLISPQNRQTSSLHDQIADAQLRVASLGHRLGDLRRQSRDLPAYRAQLARDRRALPTVPDSTAFLRELQAAASGTGVSISGLLVGAPTKVAGATTQLYALQLTLTAEGPAAKVDKFLDELQRVQPRAVLVTNASAAPAQRDASLDGTVTLTLGLQVFIDPTGSARKAQPATTQPTTTTTAS
jgi:hypothetical protein